MSDITTVLKDVHLLNALSGIVVSPSGRVISLRAEYSKHDFPKDVTPSGMLIFWREDHEKASLSIVFIVEGSVISVILPHL